MIDPLEPEGARPAGSAPPYTPALPERRAAPIASPISAQTAAQTAAPISAPNAAPPAQPGQAAAPGRTIGPGSASGPVVIPLAPPPAAPRLDLPLQPMLPGLISAEPAARCPNCGAALAAGATVCPTCGIALREKQPRIRCRRCGKAAPSVLTICPHCGRDLMAAPSRWLTIGAPVALVFALLTLFALQSGSNNPVRPLADGARAAFGWVGDLSDQLDPQMVVLPAAEGASSSTGAGAVDGGDGAAAPGDGAAAPGDGAAAPGVVDPSAMVAITAGVPITAAQALTAALPISSAAQAAPQAAAPEVAGGPAVAPEVVAPTAASPAGVAAEVTATLVALAPTPLPTLPPTALPTATAVPATATPPPTLTPTATPSPTPDAAAPVEYQVQQGDTALGIATRFGIDLETLLAVNSLTPDEAALLQPGQTLRISLQGADATGSVYTVRAGDTLIGISTLVGVPVELLMQANGFSAAAAARLQPGDAIVIPAPTPTPGPTATPTVPATATPLPPTATPTLAATATLAAAPTLAAPPATPGNTGALGMRLAAPALRGPVDGVTIRCTTAGRLLWEAAPGMAASDQFRVHLGFIGGRDEAGNPRPTWLIAQDVPASVTQVNLDPVLCRQAPAEYGNQWRWYVEVVAPGDGGTLVPVSPPSDVWGFVWN